MADEERDFVRWLAARKAECSAAAAAPPAPVRLGIGDDMAILDAPGTVLVTCDMLLDGVHFEVAQHALDAIGYKAAACSLSDCAAMAVNPRAAFLSLALPRSFTQEQVRTLAGAIADSCARFGCTLAGGDTTRWDHPLAIDVTMLAAPFPGIAPVRRDGAQPGDGLYVTGPLGGSLLGKHLSFVPRIDEARQIAEKVSSHLHAMLDISDGLALDLDRIAEASGVGATLEENAVLAIASEAAHQAAHTDGKSVLDHVLGDGEDFELLMAADIDSATATPFNLHRVGTITAQAGLRLQDAKGEQRPLSPVGYQHR